MPSVIEIGAETILRGLCQADSPEESLLLLACIGEVELRTTTKAWNNILRVLLRNHQGEAAIQPDLLRHLRGKVLPIRFLRD